MNNKTDFLEQTFLEYLPSGINKKFIKASYITARSNCITNQEQSYYFSCLNKVYQEKYSYVSVMSFISELFFLSMLKDKSKDSNRIFFSQNDKEYLQIINNETSPPIRVEIKAIPDNL